MNKITEKLVNELKSLLGNRLQLLKHRRYKIAIATAVAAAVLAAFFWPDKIEAIASLLTLPIALVGLYILHQRMKATEQQTEVVTEQTRNAARQIKEDRFAKAFEQIGNGNLAIRLGGLNLLDTIAREGQEEYKRVWDYLASFLRYPPPLHDRKNTDDNQKLVPIEKGADIAEIAKMLWEAHERYRPHHDPKSLGLSRAHLEGTYLIGAHLEGADLGWAHLERAGLREAHLEGADLWEAHLEGADLAEAHLEGTYLIGAHLEGAGLIGAHLERAGLQRAHLEGAGLREAHLEGADLSWAHLEGAGLQRAHLEGADLAEAHLEGTYLIGAHLEGANLTWAHFNEESRIDGATFKETNVSGCDFSKVKGLTKEQFQGQVYIDAYKPPKFPSGWQLETSGIKKITGAEWWKIQKKHREKRPSN